MADPELVGAVDEKLATDPERFRERVREEAATVVGHVREGTFDNPQAIVGLEHEFYAVEADRSAAGRACGLKRVPRRVLELIGFEKELGLHNAEMSTSPQPLNERGLAAQEHEVAARLSAAQAATRPEGIELVSDGLWTIPPAGETGSEYLTDSVGADGVVLAANVGQDSRYHALSNSDRGRRAGKRIDLPHATVAADTVQPLSATSSIQPHYQVPVAVDLPEYFRYALRVAGPLVALGANSPLLPPSCYDEGADPETVLGDAWHEGRVAIFETVMNPRGADREDRKVRFPRDLDSAEAAVERIAEDPAQVPTSVPERGRFDDAFAHFRHAHGTYWRWIRPVFEGASPSAANARIEFRPLPGQPTVRDAVAFQAAFAGLLESMVASEHPVGSLDWERAHRNFRVAVRDGIGADLGWIDHGGREVRGPECFRDLFAAAEDGLRARGLSAETASEYIWPLRHRFRRRHTPAAWKLDQARERVAEGADLAGAIHGAQRDYIARQRETLLSGTFADWPR